MHFVFLNIKFPTYRVATSQLALNSLTFPDFFGALFPDFPWPRDTNLMGIARNPERSEEKFFASATNGFLQKYA